MSVIRDFELLIADATRDLDEIGSGLLLEQAVNVDRAVRKGNVGEVNRTIRAMADLLKDYRISVPVGNTEPVPIDPFDVLMESILDGPPPPVTA